MTDKEKVINELQQEIDRVEYMSERYPDPEFGVPAVVDVQLLRDTLELLKEQEPEEDEMESNVKQEDVATIMNLIEKALRKTGYQTVGYDNTCIWLQVFIDRR